MRASSHFLRFCRALALLSGTPLVVGACSSSGDTTQSTDAKDDSVSVYDGVPVGTAPCDGGCGVFDDAGSDTAYDGHPVGVSIDAGPDFGGGGGPQSLPDLPFLG